MSYGLVCHGGDHDGHPVITEVVFLSRFRVWCLQCECEVDVSEENTLECREPVPAKPPDFPCWEAQWPCPNCGRLVLGNTDLCFNCGYDRSTGQVDPALSRNGGSS